MMQPTNLVDELAQVRAQVAWLQQRENQLQKALQVIESTQPSLWPGWSVQGLPNPALH